MYLIVTHQMVALALKPIMAVLCIIRSTASCLVFIGWSHSTCVSEIDIGSFFPVSILSCQVMTAKILYISGKVYSTGNALFWVRLFPCVCNTVAYEEWIVSSLSCVSVAAAWVVCCASVLYVVSFVVRLQSRSKRASTCHTSCSSQRRLSRFSETCTSTHDSRAKRTRYVE